jgi:hypothetical protein
VVNSPGHGREETHVVAGEEPSGASRRGLERAEAGITICAQRFALRRLFRRREGAVGGEDARRVCEAEEQRVDRVLRVRKKPLVGVAGLVIGATAVTAPLWLSSAVPSEASAAHGSGAASGTAAVAHAGRSLLRPSGMRSGKTDLVPSKARLTASVSSSNIPIDCVPNPAGPPFGPYELGLVGTAANGSLTAGPATVAGVNAKFCGIVTLVNGTPPCPVTGTVESPVDGQLYGPLSVELTLVPGITPTIGFTADSGTITGGFNCSSSSQNGLVVSLNAQVSGSTAPLFGVSCTIGPFDVPLTGLVTGPFNALTATLTSSDFTVPVLAPSPSCPASVAANIDDIVGLPLAPGQASASLPITASLYQPPAP